MLPAIAPAPVPRLSVIVPIYNVAAYLPACLDSLVAQRLIALEVLMVDDGSTDESAALAAEYETRDARFRLIRQENGGLGAARNTGVRNMSPRSEYLAFLDSDDIVPPDAYRAMVSTLDETGSDFATGNVHHFNSARRWQASMFRMLAARSRRRTHISLDKELVADRTACNKVYRRAFWDRHHFRFPEGVLYEDIPVTLPAHYLATAIDVFSEPVYYWRVRESTAAPSITHRRTEPGACEDRVRAVESVSRFLAARSGPRWERYKRDYDKSALLMDLRTFLNALPSGDAAYHQEFLRCANRFLDQVDPRTLRELPLDLRVQWALTRRRALPELLASLTVDRAREPVRVRGRWRRHAHFPEQGEPARLPRRARRLRRQDLRFHTPVREIDWVDGRLRISGDAWVTRLDSPSRLSHVKVAQLRRAGSRRRVVLPVSNRFRPERTAGSGGHAHCYDWAGYDLVIDPERLKRRGRWQEGTWWLGIGMLAPGVVRKGALTTPGAGHEAGYPPYHWVDQDVRVVPYAERDRLALRVERVRVLITGRAWEGDRLALWGELRTPRRDGERLTLRLRSMADGETRRYPVEVTGPSGAGTAFTVRVPARDLLPERAPATDDGGSDGDRPEPDRRGWSTVLVVSRPSGGEQVWRAVVREGLDDGAYPLPEELRRPGGAAELAAVAGNNGYLKLWTRAAQAVLTEARWSSEGRLRLTGRTTAAVTGAARLVLQASARREERTVPLRLLDGGLFEAEFPPSAVEGPAGPLPLRGGDWNLLLRPEDADGPDLTMKIDRLAVPGVSRLVDSGGRSYQLRVRCSDRPQLQCHSELSPMERGNFRQRELLREVYRPMRSLPLREAVLYLSYNGKQCSDNPRAIHEELLRRDVRLQHLWVVRDGQAPLPPGARAVRLWSREWFEALAGSRYVVTNAHLPDWLERRDGQVIVQTWHGTMLKKIGHDIERPQFDRAYHDRVRRDIRNWSLLVSANRFSTPILRRAFGYQGEILEAGYPRNDRLYHPDRERLAQRVRERLGLPPGKKVLLYAPTWRDDLGQGRGDFRLDLRLDVAEAERRLGADHVLLLRRHSHVADRIPAAGRGFVWDVSEYPDIGDLYLIADALITDYSSAMFDFAHTRRPMLFFTYDLEHYRDTLRGFYFDFERQAPGPLLRTSEELIDAVRTLDQVAETYREPYQRFVERFCDLDDGGAASRVVDRMLELGLSTADPRTGPSPTTPREPTPQVSESGGTTLS